VHDLDLTGTDELIHRRPADRQHASRFDHGRQQNPVWSFSPFVPVSFITTDKRARAVKRDNGNRGQSENHTDASAMPDTGGSRVSAISVARAAT
jgi:hypothetical protein